MEFRPNNFAFIDSNNLHLSIENQGWSLDYFRFRKYLLHKFSVQRAFQFLGYIEKNQKLYDGLRKYGYEIIFKPTLMLPNGSPKGNVDAELILHVMKEYQNYDRAIIVAGDGDYHCLVEHLANSDKLERLIIPNKHNYSRLLSRFNKYIIFIEDFKEKVEFRKH
jgi:uncharacterized LabA/DUF88 family protein